MFGSISVFFQDVSKKLKAIIILGCELKLPMKLIYALRDGWSKRSVGRLNWM